MPIVVNNKHARVRGFGPEPVKDGLPSKWGKEVNSFLPLFAVLMRQTGVPRSAQVKYLYFMRKQLLNQRSGFLKKCRAFPVYGLRLLGDDVFGDRDIKNDFSEFRCRRNTEGVLLPNFMFYFWNQLFLMRKDIPSKQKALKISRILAVLSFSKFLLYDSKTGRRKAILEYQRRIEEQSGYFNGAIDGFQKDPEYKLMLEFLKSLGISRGGELLTFDERCFSLKSLVGKKPFRPSIPQAYWQGMSGFKQSLGELDEDGRFTFRTDKWFDRNYYSNKEYEGKLSIIVESGGKYRGVCPYSSPYAHSTTCYARSRDALLRISGNCNYDQKAGHVVACSMSNDNNPVVSSDASNFTDTADVNKLSKMACALGCSGAVLYHSLLPILGFDGRIITSDVPLMGWKGTFDLCSVLLAYSVWLSQHTKSFRFDTQQCGDDLIGYGTLDEYRSSYESIGCSLSEGKTIVSKTVTIFCGEMYWRGLEVTPIRFLLTGLSETHKYIGKLIKITRDFVSRCNYTIASKRFIYGFIKDRLSRRYNGYLDFILGSNLGGIPLNLKPTVSLDKYIRSNNRAFFCACINIPFEKELFSVYSDYFFHLPLGKPYDIYGLGTSLREVSWPVSSRVALADRKRVIRDMLNAKKMGYQDVLLYAYDNMLLRP